MGPFIKHVLELVDSQFYWNVLFLLIFPECPITGLFVQVDSTTVYFPLLTVWLVPEHFLLLENLKLLYKYFLFYQYSQMHKYPLFKIPTRWCMENIFIYLLIFNFPCGTQNKKIGSYSLISINKTIIEA